MPPRPPHSRACLALALAGWAGAASAEQASFTQTDESDSLGRTEDSYIVEASNNDEENFSEETFLAIDLENGDYADMETRALIRFPKAFGEREGQIPPGAEIESAELELWVTNEGGTVSAHLLLEAWDVDEVSWDNRGGDMGPWSEQGAGAPSSEEQALDSFHVAAGEKATLDLSEAVRIWTADPTENHGVLLVTDSTDGTDLAASEYADQGMRPVLTVEYTPPEDPPPVDTGDSGEPQDSEPADSGDGAQDTGEPGVTEPGGGCGCGGAAPLGWALLGGLALVRRRRR